MKFVEKSETLFTAFQKYETMFESFQKNCGMFCVL